MVPSIEGAQGEDEPVAPVRREGAEIGTWFTAGESTPQTQRRSGADIEEPVEGQ